MKLHIKIVILLSFISLSYSVNAQFIDDWEARFNPSLEYKINDKWSVEGKYYLYLYDNMTRYEKSVVGVEAGYKINSWLSAGIDYRFGFSQQSKNHELRYVLKAGTNLFSERWKFEFRTLLQQKVYREHIPNFYWRNRAKFIFQASPIIEIYVSTETYLKIYHGLEFNTQKTSLGTAFAIGKKSELGFEVNLKNKTNEQNYVRFELAYKYTIGK